jgi:hypothetical protein
MLYATPLLPDKYGTNWRGWGRLKNKFASIKKKKSLCSIN